MKQEPRWNLGFSPEISCSKTRSKNTRERQQWKPKKQYWKENVWIANPDHVLAKRQDYFRAPEEQVLEQTSVAQNKKKESSKLQVILRRSWSFYKIGYLIKVPSLRVQNCRTGAQDPVISWMKSTVFFFSVLFTNIWQTKIPALLYNYWKAI